MSTTTLPRHSVTGVLAVGWRKARDGETGPQPIWPILGAAEDDDKPDDSGNDEPDEDEPDDADKDPDGADELGDKGKQALDRMKAKLKAERERRKAAEDRLTDGAKKDDEPDADEVRRQAEQAATAKANQRLLRAEVRAAAKGKLADPQDAFKFLDLDQFEVGADGEIDADDIEDALDDLLKTKPYLAAQSSRRFQGTGDGGAATRKAPKPKQLTRDDLKTMTPQQIVKAKNDGRLTDLFGAQ